VGTAQGTDVCLFTEEDELFNVGIGKTKSERFLMVESGSTETEEWHAIDLEVGADAPLALLQVSCTRTVPRPSCIGRYAHAHV
jgi:oligopeptidase B